MPKYSKYFKKKKEKKMGGIILIYAHFECLIDILKDTSAKIPKWQERVWKLQVVNVAVLQLYHINLQYCAKFRASLLFSTFFQTNEKWVQWLIGTGASINGITV